MSKKKGVNKSLRTPQPTTIDDWVEKGEVTESPATTEPEKASPALQFDPANNPGTKGSEVVTFHVPYDVKDEIDLVAKNYRRKMAGMTFSRAQIMRVLLYAFANSSDEFKDDFFSSDDEKEMVQVVLKKLSST